MSKRVLMVLVAALMIFGFTMDSRAAGSAPVLEEAFVTPEINHGELLKVYIRATDADADMKYVVVTVGRDKGASAYASMTRLSKGVRGEINGYLYYDTGKAFRKDVSGFIQVSIEDYTGNSSNAISLPLKIKTMGAKIQPPPAGFQNQEIGPVLIDPVDFGGK